MCLYTLLANASLHVMATGFARIAMTFPILHATPATVLGDTSK